MNTGSTPTISTVKKPHAYDYLCRNQPLSLDLFGNDIDWESFPIEHDDLRYRESDDRPVHVHDVHDDLRYRESDDRPVHVNLESGTEVSSIRQLTFFD